MRRIAVAIARACAPAVFVVLPQPGSQGVRPTHPEEGPQPELRGALRPPPTSRGGAPDSPTSPASYPPTQGCASPLGYCGGPIVSNPTIVQVSWNDPGSTVAATIESYLQTWWPAILSPQAGYLAWLTEYGTVGLSGHDGLPGSGQTFAGFGNYAGIYRITPSLANQGAQLDDAAIRAELVAQIAAGTLPVPTFDATGNCDTLYMIDLPPSVTTVTLTFGGKTETSCAQFCGYHMGAIYDGSAIGYAVFPDPTVACAACAPDGLDQDLGSVHSHELAEAITDPDLFLENLTPASTDCMRPGAWDQLASGCGEIGDSCSWPTVVPSVTVGGQTFYVQGLYDNARMDCETSGPTQPCTTSAGCTPPIPVCDPTGHTCRACLPGDCVGSTPACATTGPHAGSCVACASNAECQADLHAPVCDATANTCRACVPADCVALTPACATTGPLSGRCVQCATNADCSGATPICSASGSCLGASQDAGILSDAQMPPSDAGGPPDAGSSLEAGTAHDAGQAHDAGGVSDAGGAPRGASASGGCACVAADSEQDLPRVSLLGPLLLAAVAARRARRQGR